MQTQVKSITWLLAAILSICTLSLTAQDLPKTTPSILAPAGPIATIEFEEAIYDFGTIEEGTKVSHVFTFTNTGDEPLFFTNAQGSCGCTVPKWPREPIVPGETASITVEFNSRGKRGTRNQKVTLTANTDPRQTFIYLKGKVNPQDMSDPNIFIPAENELKEEVPDDCFAIYPNPTAEILKLDMAENNLGQRAIISIYAKSGQLMAKREVEAIDGPIEFNVSHYPAGTYVANVQIADREPEARCFVVVD